LIPDDGFSKAARLNPDGLKPIIPFSLSDPGRSCLNDFNRAVFQQAFFPRMVALLNGLLSTVKLISLQESKVPDFKQCM